MKEIKAFVKPFKVMDIFHHLKESGFPNLTVSMAEGTGKLKSEESAAPHQFSITDSRVAKIEVVCENQALDTIVQIITENAYTGNSGDGIIYVSEVEKIYRVRNGIASGK
ncbi:MAG: P-II family nitrogen regulator [Bacteroidales bacterium]|nr:P-II family nitrogen regulator [Bacteroidales bacterium]